MPVVDDDSRKEDCDEFSPTLCSIDSNIYSGAKFKGYQKSKNHQYSVEVQIGTV